MVTKLHHTVFYEETLMRYVLKLTITFNGKYLKRYIIYCRSFLNKKCCFKLRIAEQTNIYFKHFDVCVDTMYRTYS